MGKVMPINHLKFMGKQFDGGFTFFGGNGNSQIDFFLLQMNMEENSLTHLH